MLFDVSVQGHSDIVSAHPFYTGIGFVRKARREIAFKNAQADAR